MSSAALAALRSEGTPAGLKEGARAPGPRKVSTFISSDEDGNKKKAEEEKEEKEEVEEERGRAIIPEGGLDRSSPNGVLEKEETQTNLSHF
ncbi:uncharacterized [Tachysurus ichikawai]